MSTIPLVRDIMTKKVVTLTPEMEIQEAIHRMLKHNVSGAPVIAGKNELQGMLSEKDLMRLFAAAAFSDLPRGLVAEYMVMHPETVSPNQDLFSLATIFMHRHYRRIPVVEDNQLIGIVSRRDVLRSSLEFWENRDGGPWTDSKYLTEDLKAALE